MGDRESKYRIRKVFQTKFLRAVFIWMVVIFLAVVLTVITIVFSLFTSEINKKIIGEKQKQLSLIENSISRRMDEAVSIAYSIGEDRSFYLDVSAGEQYTSYEMAQIMKRYLAGNDFVEYLAYYRLAEPNKVFTASGEMAFTDFYDAYLDFQGDTADAFLARVKSISGTTVLRPSARENGQAYFTFVAAIPHFSKNPQAFVIMMVPEKEVKVLLESQLANCDGEVGVFDGTGALLYRLGNLSDFPEQYLEQQSEGTFSYKGKDYIVQKVTSESNHWSYTSIIRLNDIVAEVAHKQSLFMILLVVLMLLAIAAMFFCIFIKYKPITKLLMSYARLTEQGKMGGVLDEEQLIASTITELRDSSEQRQIFEAAYHEAEAANRAKSAFFSTMSHDIRTPMNAIVGMTELAMKNMNDTQYVKECLQNVRVASAYLLDIINNVLDMSRIESGKLTLSEDVIELPKLVHEIITIISHNVEVKSQKLVVRVGSIANEKFVGDYVRLTQVFMNILSNAVKFTPNGGCITFRLSQEGAADGYGDYLFEITDTGIGMSQEFVKRVFESFTRDEAADLTKVEGTGLGMAIAKNFVDMMGGSIHCESEQGVGTTFSIRLHSRLATENSDLPEARAEYQTKRVLIIEPEDETAQYQKQLFSELMVSAVSVPTVEEALLLLQSDNEVQFDIVIINQTTDDKHGIDTVRRLKIQLGQCEQAGERAPESDVTFVLAAGDMFLVQKSDAYEAGISQFVQLPLFRSTIIGIFHRQFELQNIREKSIKLDLTGKRILLVEDNTINRKIAAAFLRDTNAEIIEVTNGREAVDAFKEHDAWYFDLILMDVQMPVMNGYEATLAIRSVQREDATRIPIYAMTANTFDEDVRQVKEVGMNGHLGKPYAADELYRILKLTMTVSDSAKEE